MEEEVIQTTDDFFAQIGSYFSTNLDYPAAFAQHRMRKEGWFQGELCHLFSRWQESKRLSDDWRCELPIREAFPQDDWLSYPRQNERIDFRVSVNQQHVYVEVKSVYVAPPGEEPRLSWIHKEIKGDLYKLKLCKPGNKFCLIFVYPSLESGLRQSFFEAIAEAGGNLDPASQPDITSSKKLAMYVVRLS